MSTNGRIGGGISGDANRDPRLDRLYHDAPREEPPAHIDAAILAAAHREVGSRPRAGAAWLRAWRVPVSIAAVVVLSVSVVTLVREEGGGELDSSTVNKASSSMSAARAPAMAQESASARDRATPVEPAPDAGKARQQEAPKQAASRDDAAPAAKEESAKRAAAESAKLSEEAAVRRSVGMASEQSAAEPRAPVPPPAAPAPQPSQGGMALRDPRPAPSTGSASDADMARSAIGIRGSSGETAFSAPEEQKPQAQTGPVDRPAARERAAADSAGSSSAQRPAPAPAAKSAPRTESRATEVERPDSKVRLAPLLKELEPQAADKWVERIESLRREGRGIEADELLAEFKRRFPDYPLPAALR